MKRTRSITALLLAVLMMLSVFSGCGDSAEQPSGSSGTGDPAGSSEPAQSGKTYVIGVDCPMTGGNSGFGEQMSLGAQMAVDEINAAGGIDGVMLSLNIQDDKSDPKEAATIATKFCADKNVVAIFGFYNSSCCLAALPIINESGKLTICTGSNPDISTANQTYGFRIEPSDNQQAVYTGNWMIEDGRQKVAILYETSDYGMGQEKIISEMLTQAGAEVVCSEAYVINETRDFTNILTKVKNSGADSLFIGGTYTEGALIAKQQISLGMNLPIYSSSSMFEVQYLDAAGDAAEGTKVQGVLDPNNPSEIVQNFEREYRAKFGEDKTAGTFSAHAYFSINMIADAIRATGGTDSKAMADYIASTTFDTVYGTVSFNETHDLIFDKLTRLVVENGKFVVVE